MLVNCGWPRCLLRPLRRHDPAVAVGSCAWVLAIPMASGAGVCVRNFAIIPGIEILAVVVFFTWVITLFTEEMIRRQSCDDPFAKLD